MEKGDVSLGEIDIGAQNRREISRALRSHWCIDVITYIGNNVLDVVKENLCVLFFQNSKNPVNCEFCWILHCCLF